MFTPATDKKIALFLADGCEEIEALTVADLAYRAGIPCTKVSITDSTTVVSSHDVTIVADTVIGALPFDEYDMLVLPGGMPGTTHLGACAKLKEEILRHASGEKPVAAICAAPSVLASLGLLRGVRAACNPSVETLVIDGGAELVREPAVRDGRIITSRGMGTASPFGLAIVEYYLGRETARKLGENILYGIGS